MGLRIEKYTEEISEEWDDFVLNKSMNGTFLQTRRFINYHEDGRFKDCSLCVRKGQELVATLLACDIEEDGGAIFFGHKGSTYGGICVSPQIYNTSSLNEMFTLLTEYWNQNGYGKVFLKFVPQVYQRKNTDLLDYFCYKFGFQCYSELNFYMNLNRYGQDILSQFTSGKRRDYRYSLKNELTFKELTSKAEIEEYYCVLQMNLRKLNLLSVHSLSDLYDIKYNRFNDEVKFYGVFYKGKIIAGSMIFIFDNKIFHTQYLSSDERYLKLFPMDFLVFNLIQTAVDNHMEKFTFGICTEERGKYLNLGLSRFKEGFGTEYCINYSYELQFK